MKKIITTLLITGGLFLNSNTTNAQCYSAVQLDGINDYLHSPFSNYTFNNFTMEMWINSADYSPNEHYISLYQNSYIVLGGWDGSGFFNTWASGLSPVDINSSAVSTPATGTWHHIAFVYDGLNQILYIDGVAIATEATTGTIESNPAYNSGIVIGARYTQASQFSNTSFEDVRIWNVARTSAELNSNMSINLMGTEPGLVAYYRFEDGVGSSTVTDLTGNGNTLTMYNMDPLTDWISGPFGNVQSTDIQSSCGPITWIDGNSYSSDTIGATFTYVAGSINGCDSVVTLNLTINSAAQSTDVQAACNSYTWIDGNTYTSTNNSATFNIVGAAANGCDSLVTLDLTITNVSDITTMTSGETISANSASATYQWLDCDNGNAIIVGETGQSFTATVNGNYAVQLTENGCLDTSACVIISSASLNEKSLESRIVVAPNPSTGVFSISSLSYSGEVTIKVMDVTGKIIFNSTEKLGTNSTANIDISDASNGFYIVNVSDLNESYSTRVVKK